MSVDLVLVKSGSLVNNMGRTCSVMPNGTAMVQQDNLGPEVPYNNTVLGEVALIVEDRLNWPVYYSA